MRIVLSLFIFSSTIASSISFANDFLLNDFTPHEKNYFKQSERFARIEEDRVYIQGENIYFSETQILVCIQEDLIPIERLNCDENGFFISANDIEIGRGRQETWICKNPDCGYENYVGIDYCGICGLSRHTKN